MCFLIPKYWWAGFNCVDHPPGIQKIYLYLPANPTKHDLPDQTFQRKPIVKTTTQPKHNTKTTPKQPNTIQRKLGLTRLLVCNLTQPNKTKPKQKQLVLTPSFHYNLIQYKSELIWSMTSNT